MNEKIYYIKDLNELRFSNEEYSEIKELDYSLSKGKSIFALGNDKIESIYPRRVQSKKLPKLNHPFNTSKRRIKETSVPLPFIGKEQGTIANYLPLMKSPDSVRNNTKNHHYFKKPLNLEPLDIGCLTAVGYKLKFVDNEIKK